jgi:putative DNA primase/helicase
MDFVPLSFGDGAGTNLGRQKTQQMQWTRNINRDNPCPVCGRIKYCLINTNGSAVLCTKVESDRPVGDAGFLHVLNPKGNIGYEPSEFEKLFLRYRQNVIAGMAEIIASDLSVTAASVEQLGVGFYPLENTWVWAEMDEHGNVIGLLKRYHNGKKVMVKGSSRGLIYQYPLPKTDKPILVVEGASDVLAAMDMGYVCVGRPSADGGGKLLSPLLKGKDAIVVGENDDGAGVHGMMKMFSILKPVCKTLRKVLPPSGKKDLRAWHPNAAEFEQWVDQYADTADTSRVIEDVNPFELAARWVNEVYMARDTRLFHWLHGAWYKHNGVCYETVDDEFLDRDLYEYFNQFNVVRTSGKDVKCKRLNPNAHFIKDLKHALAATVCVKPPNGVFEPFKINSGEHIDVTKTIVFQNGLLDVDTGELRPLTPNIFVTSTLPYDYDPRAQCKLWRGFVRDVFNGDQGCHDLLQEWFGYNLIASNYMQAMMFLIGVRSSGKSTTANVLQNLLGSERCSAINVQDLFSDFGLHSLVGKYAAFIPEPGQLGKYNSQHALQRIKQITGGDTVSINRKFKEAISVKLFSRLTYADNFLPSFQDESRAFLRRVNLLYFGNDCTQKEQGIDRQLGQKLASEVQGIANWALEGLRRLLRQGHFTEPEPSREYLERIAEMSAPIRRIITAHCHLSKDRPNEAWASTDQLYELYKAVCDDEGEPVRESKEQFVSKLKAHFPWARRGQKRTDKGDRPWGYFGIQIHEEAKRKYLDKP